MIFSRLKVSAARPAALLGAIVLLLAVTSFPGPVEAAKKATGAAAAAPPPSAAVPVEHEPVIEEVTQKQLERILAEKEYVAVYWCKCGREEVVKIRNRTGCAYVWCVC